MHDRPAQFVKNHDGDSVTMLLDQDYFDMKKISIRLANVWAPELSQLGGVAVKHYVTDWFADRLPFALDAWNFIVITYVTSVGTPLKTFDRFVADVMTIDGKHHLNSDVMRFIVEQGYTGGTGAPVRDG